MHWRFTTPLICTKNTRHELKSVALFLGLNQQSDKVLLCLVFLWKKFVLCPLLVGKREEKRCFLQITVCFICQETAEWYKTFSTSNTFASSSLATSLLPLVVKVLQYSISTDRPVGVLAWPLTMQENNHQNIHLRRNPPLNTLPLSCINNSMFCKLQNYYFTFKLPHTLVLKWFVVFPKDILNMTHKLGVSWFLSIKRGRVAI